MIFSHEDLSSRPASLVKRSEELELEVEDIDLEVETESPQVSESILESDFPGLEFWMLHFQIYLGNISNLAYIS